VKIEVETGSRSEVGWLDKTLPQQQQRLAGIFDFAEKL
jgi:hypothetical protein